MLRKGDLPVSTNIGRCLLLIIAALVMTVTLCPVISNSYADDLKVTIKIGGTGGAMGAMKELAVAFQKKHPEAEFVFVPHLGTRGGIKAVMEGAIDIGLAGRPLNPDERSAGLKEVEYSRSPFVLVVSKDSAVTNVTLDQVVNIYLGKMKTWPDGTPVRLILRPEGDVDTIMLKGMSANMQEAVKKAQLKEGLTTALTDQDCATAIEKTKGAFGPSTLTQIISEKRSLKALALNGVTPGTKAIADGTYPYFKAFHMITGPKSSPAVRAFIEFLKSREGGSVLARTGNYVPR